MKIPEAAAVYFPSPSVAKLKIDVHMMEVQRPQSTKRTAAIGTTTVLKDEPEKTGIETVTVFPKKIAKTINTIATEVAIVIIALLETLFAMKLEQKRPTSIRNQ